MSYGGNIAMSCSGNIAMSCSGNIVMSCSGNIVVSCSSNIVLSCSGNTVLCCSGKAFGRLMQKHKGLLRVDLRNNAQGFSGVLQMMPKQATTSVTPLKDSNSSTWVANSGAVARVSKAFAAQEESGASGPVKPVPNRKGLVPVMTSDGHTPLRLEPEGSSQKENMHSSKPESSQQPRKAKAKSGRAVVAASKPPRRPKHAKHSTAAHTEFLEFNFAPQPQRTDVCNVEPSDFLEFGFTSQHELQSRSAANLAEVQCASENEHQAQSAADLADCEDATALQQEPAFAKLQGGLALGAHDACDRAASATFAGWAPAHHARAQLDAAVCEAAHRDTWAHQESSVDHARLPSMVSLEGEQYQLNGPSSHGFEHTSIIGLPKAQLKSSQQQSFAAYAVQSGFDMVAAAQHEAMVSQPACLQRPHMYMQQDDQAAMGVSPTAHASVGDAAMLSGRLWESPILLGQTQAVPGQMQTAPGQIQAGSGQMQTAPGQMQTAPGQMQAGSGQMQTAPGQMQTAPGQIQAASGRGQKPLAMQGSNGRQGERRPWSAAVGSTASKQPKATYQQQQTVQHRASKPRQANSQWSRAEPPTSVWPQGPLVSVSEAQAAPCDDADSGEQALYLAALLQLKMLSGSRSASDTVLYETQQD